MACCSGAACLRPFLPPARLRLSRCASTLSAPPSPHRPFRLAIIGSGPAGFYAAARLIQKSSDALVDVYEKLPAPFGLVRYGVAPDHPEVKNCQEKFEQVASSPRLTFIGNVSVGDQIPLRALVPHYDALLFAYGAAQDRHVGIPGEALSGVISARSFVGWYNGLPEHASLQPDLEAADNAYIIGNGNVALDVARILLSDLDTLRETDIAEHAVETLSRSRIKKVSICGRRGPMQAAFTIKEVRELLTMPALAFDPVRPELLPQAGYISSLPRLEQRKYRLPQLLAKGSAIPSPASHKSWALESMISPIEFVGSDSRLSSIVFAQNAYDNFDERLNPKARVHSTSCTFERPTKLAFRSIGYKSVALAGLTEDLGVPFNHKLGIIPNDLQGRVVGPDDASSALQVGHIAGCYCTGWVKRGPTGVIASTMEDAFSSADAIMLDWQRSSIFLNGTSISDRKGTGRGWEGVLEEAGVTNNSHNKEALRRVSWEDWLLIDKAEQQRGKRSHKPREKFKSIGEMLAVLD